MEPSQEDRRWKRLAAALFRIPQRRPDEAFVARVMSALPVEESGGPSPWRWRVPALGFALAGAIFMLRTIAADESVSTEMVLLADGREAVASSWLAEPPATDEFFGLGQEEP